MDVEKETAPAGNAVTDKAAEIVCAWLARHGLELAEITETDSNGREWNSGMEIRPDPKKSVCMDKMFPTWDWSGSLRTPDKAWLIVVNWMFGLSFDGPSWIQTTDESRSSPGRIVFRKKRFPVPKLAFSSLEEFVLKAAVLPEFQEISRQPARRNQTAEDPSAALDMLVKALSEMAKPYGYVVEALLDSGSMAALGIRRSGREGEWLASMCETLPEGGSFSFPDKKSAAAELVSKYGSRPAWNAYFFCELEVLRFPGGSPEELALKAAAGIKADMLNRRSGIS